MEEKLYFKPASYGKGIKKKPEPEKLAKTEKGEKNHRFRNLTVFMLFLAIIIVAILWLLRGRTTTTGQYPENIKNESLTCASDNITYSKIGSVLPTKHELKINMVFYGEEKLSSINLRYNLTFASDAEAYAAEAKSHADFNLGLQKSGHSSGSFHNKFTLMDNTLNISLRADNNEIDELTREYFLLDRTNPPTTINEYQANYEAQGFSCSSTINNPKEENV